MIKIFSSSDVPIPSRPRPVFVNNAFLCYLRLLIFHLGKNAFRLGLIEKLEFVLFRDLQNLHFHSMTFLKLFSKGFPTNQISFLFVHEIKPDFLKRTFVINLLDSDNGWTQNWTYEHTWTVQVELETKFLVGFLFEPRIVVHDYSCW